MTHRVLVVDDNPDAAESLTMVLRLWGHVTETAPDGPSALQLAERFKPDRAIVDIGIPGIDGYEVARRMRAAPRDPDLFLIALTGYGRDDDRRAALEAGFDLHMVKPPNLDDLREALATGSATPET